MANKKCYLYKKQIGPLDIPMTNDYLFRALMQRNEAVLKALLASLLRLKENRIDSINILNPIELGRIF